jgi:hypothetical protein
MSTEDLKNDSITEMKAEFTAQKLLLNAKNKKLQGAALYEVEFEDDRVKAFHANQITDSIYARVDDDGYTVFEVDDIVDCGSPQEGRQGWGWGWIGVGVGLRSNYQGSEAAVPPEE